MAPGQLATCLPIAWSGFLDTLTAAPLAAAQQLPPPHTAQPPVPAHTLNQHISVAEIETAVQALHSGRSGVLLGHTSEFLCHAKLAPIAEDPALQILLVPYLHPLFNAAFTSGHFPQSWRTSLVTPIFKRGDATQAANYRPTAVGEPISRLYASILVRRLVQFTKQQQLRPITQTAYWPQLGTIHQVFNLQHVMTNTSVPSAPCTCALRTSRLPMTRFSGCCSGRCWRGWGFRDPCMGPYSIFMTAACCL